MWLDTRGIIGDVRMVQAWVHVVGIPESFVRVFSLLQPVHSSKTASRLWHRFAGRLSRDLLCSAVCPTLFRHSRANGGGVGGNWQHGRRGRDPLRQPRSEEGAQTSKPCNKAIYP